MNILCQICGSLIATADKEDLQIPLHGSMLHSPYPERMPESLFPDTEWEFLKCPVCLHRPFLTDDIVLTDEGIYRIPERQEVVEITEEDLKEAFTEVLHGVKSELSEADVSKGFGDAQKKKTKYPDQ